jgi:hypothetical protein
MADAFTYDVIITGMENIPLRTTKEGAKALMTAFDNGDKACEVLVNAMAEGIEFNNNLVTIRKGATNEPGTGDKPARVQKSRTTKRS